MSAKYEIVHEIPAELTETIKELTAKGNSNFTVYQDRKNPLDFLLGYKGKDFFRSGRKFNEKWYSEDDFDVIMSYPETDRQYAANMFDIISDELEDQPFIYTPYLPLLTINLLITEDLVGTSI